MRGESWAWCLRSRAENQGTKNLCRPLQMCKLSMRKGVMGIGLLWEELVLKGFSEWDRGQILRGQRQRDLYLFSPER